VNTHVRNVLPLLLLLLALAAAACGGSAREGGGGGGGGGSVEYSVSAQQNYERGMKLLQDEEWQDAVKYFAFVKGRFPYSKYAVLADLRVADAAYGAESFLEAADQYKLFIKFHPTHEMVENGYCAYRVGASYYHLLPDDWFLVPPAFEKDQTAAVDAARELSLVAKNFPNSPYASKARELHRKVARLLAQHEWYVAEFYWKRDQPMGTVLRLRTLLKQYPDVGYDEEALFFLGRAYLRVGRKEDAKKSFETLVERYPKHSLADDARSRIKEIGG
jgi:outer membrane protein assembly factor BamD